MAVLIVDGLELVHIDHQQRVHAAGRIACAVFPLPNLIEHAQVEQAGERIGLRQILDPLARFGDVGRQGRGQVRDQKKRRQLSHRLTGIRQ